MEEVAKIEQRLAAAMIGEFNLDTSALALDMTNFANYIDSGNQKTPIAQRGKAKRKQARRHPVPGDDRPAEHTSHRSGRAG